MVWGMTETYTEHQLCPGWVCSAFQTYSQSVEVTAGNGGMSAAAGGAGGGGTPAARLRSSNGCQAHWQPSRSRRQARPGKGSRCSQAQHSARWLLLGG